MDYSEIKQTIIEININLLYTVQPDIHNYTKQSSEENIIEEIESAVYGLIELKNKLIL